jgi:hypothetical protein
MTFQIETVLIFASYYVILRCLLTMCVLLLLGFNCWTCIIIEHDYTFNVKGIRALFGQHHSATLVGIQQNHPQTYAFHSFSLAHGQELRQIMTAFCHESSLSCSCLKQSMINHSTSTENHRSTDKYLTSSSQIRVDT